MVAREYPMLPHQQNLNAIRLKYQTNARKENSGINWDKKKTISINLRELNKFDTNFIFNQLKIHFNRFNRLVQIIFCSVQLIHISIPKPSNSKTLRTNRFSIQTTLVIMSIFKFITRICYPFTVTKNNSSSFNTLRDYQVKHHKE